MAKRGRKKKIWTAERVVPKILFKMQDFSDDVFIWRARQDFNREQMAIMAGIGAGTIASIEREDSVPSLNSYARLCALMEVPLSKYMKGWKDAPDPSGG